MKLEQSYLGLEKLHASFQQKKKIQLLLTEKLMDEAI